MLPAFGRSLREGRSSGPGACPVRTPSHVLSPLRMDRFVVKRSAEEPGGDGKKPRLEEEAGGLPHPSQPSQEIRAQGLSLEYRLLFGRAEADAIFQQLEKEVEYFEGKAAEGEGLIL